jgi:hypothetical protein
LLIGVGEPTMNTWLESLLGSAGLTNALTTAARPWGVGMIAS